VLEEPLDGVALDILGQGELCSAVSSWPGSEMCRGSVPWPYRTAGTFLSRRMRRAAPLPNSVRGSADKRTSDTMLDSYVVRRLAAVSVLSRRHAEAGTQMGHVDRRVDNGTGDGSLAGQP